MLERQNAKVIRPDAVIHSKRETRHQISPHTSLLDAPPLRSIQDRAYGKLRRIEKLPAKRGNPLLVKPSGLDQLRSGIGVVNQAHPIARRAARITSSWVRPCTSPDESSSSRRMASAMASRSFAAARPASMLCQRAWARDTRSEIGSAIASLVSCCVDMGKK